MGPVQKNQTTSIIIQRAIRRVSFSSV